MMGENLKILLYGNPMLRRKTALVKKIDNKIKKVIADLKVTMLNQNGLGLAANQIGESVAIFVFNPRGVNIDADAIAIINPEIMNMVGKEEREEACLSLPGIVEVVPRASEVVIKGLDEKGKVVKMTGKGLLARIFQHEIDHLNGIFFIDHISPMRRRFLKKQLNEITNQEIVNSKSN